MGALKSIAPVVGAIIVAILWVANCTGPMPAVQRVQLSPPSTPGGPYEVTAVVLNQGGGHGEVDVSARLREMNSPRTVANDRRITLQAHDTAVVVIDIQAPKGEYTPQVDATYPPR